MRLTRQAGANGTSLYGCSAENAFTLCAKQEGFSGTLGTHLHVDPPLTTHQELYQLSYQLEQLIDQMADVHILYDVAYITSQVIPT